MLIPSGAMLKDRRRNPPGPLPPLYARWMGELLTGPIPPETEATCDDCAMCPGKGDGPAGSSFFRPDTKCCTYVPRLPNFLVGCILADGDSGAARGRASVEARLEARVGVTPLGLSQPPVHRALYQLGGAAAFGRARTLRCPHFVEEDGGRCAIWAHRNAVCATWFCKHVRGAEGARFWRSLWGLLEAVETGLAHWCVQQLGLGAEALHRLLLSPEENQGQPKSLDANALDGVVDPVDYRALWGIWHGRERDFFRRCARLVTPLAWRRVAALSGAEVQLLSHLAAAAFAALRSRKFPDRLACGTFQAVPLGRDVARVVAYSSYDPLAVPRTLLDLLPHFDGRPTRQARRAIRRKTGITLEAALLRRLADFEILVRPTSRA